MFYGEYQHSIDRKGRLILPAKFREVAKANFIEKFYVTRGLDKCLFMFSEEEWRSQENKLKGLSFTKQQARTFNRLYFSGASEVAPDRQGRIIIPQYLKDFAGIKREVVIVGISNRVEVWAKAGWESFYASSSATFEDIAQNLLEEPGAS